MNHQLPHLLVQSDMMNVWNALEVPAHSVPTACRTLLDRWVTVAFVMMDGIPHITHSPAESVAIGVKLVSDLHIKTATTVLQMLAQ